MRTVLLARTENEARDFARSAGLRPPEYVLAGSATSLYGLKLSEEDLIFEFPGFRERRDAQAIIDMLKVSSKKSGGAGPRWERASAS